MRIELFLIAVLIISSMLLKSCKSFRQSSDCYVDEKTMQRLELRDSYEIKSTYTFLNLNRLTEDSVNLKGRVFDRITGKPLDAVVNVMGKPISVMVTKEGEFSLRIRREPIRIEVVSLGKLTFRTKKLIPKGDCSIDLCIGKEVIK